MDPWKEPPVTAPSSEVCELAPINTHVVPLLLDLIERRKKPRHWEEGEFSNGLTALCDAQIGLLMGCGDQITESIDRMHRMLANALNGIEYSVTGTDPETGKPIIEPEIPDVPAPLNPERAALRVALDELPGIVDAGWFGFGGRKATIADLLAALRIGNSQEASDLGDEIRSLLDGTSSTAVIADFIEDLINNSAQTAAEGGLLVVSAASAIANAAMMGMLSGQIDRLIASLDGGGLIGPGDNVLKALRGDMEASETRNVIDAAQNVILRDKIDQLIAEVIKINDSEADLTDLLAKLEDIRLSLE